MKIIKYTLMIRYYWNYKRYSGKIECDSIFCKDTAARMNPNYLDFEQPIADLDSKIDELRHLSTESGINIAEEVAGLQAKSKTLTEKIFSDLSVWQKAQIARHPKGVLTFDYVHNLIDGFDELHGDRLFGDDQALVGGIGEFRGRPVMVIGHEKGPDSEGKGGSEFWNAPPRRVSKRSASDADG